MPNTLTFDKTALLESQFSAFTICLKIQAQLLMNAHRPYVHKILTDFLGAHESLERKLDDILRRLTLLFPSISLPAPSPLPLGGLIPN
jgi:hypothetical protein